MKIFQAEFRADRSRKLPNSLVVGLTLLRPRDRLPTSMKPAVALVILTAVWSLCSSGAWGQDIPFRTMRTEHFIIYYSPNHIAVARKAAHVAEQWHQTLTEKLGIKAGGITPIYLYPDRRSFARATGHRPEESIVGTAHVRSLAIKVDASDTFARIQDIIPHELVHVLVSRYLGISARRLPLYMHEGLAKYLTDDWSAGDSELLSKVASSGRFIPLNRLVDQFPTDPEEQGIAYVQGYSITEYIVRKYGPESISDLLSEIKAGRTYAVAVEYSLGTNVNTLEQEWRNYLWDKYGMERWLRLGMATVSAGMALLGLFAFRARWIRKRRKAAELEGESLNRNVDYGQHI